MRRLIAWIGGVASAVVAYRFWRRHQQAAPVPSKASPPEPDDRAEELRAKLAESRDTDVAAEPATDEQPAEDEPVAETDPPDSPEERRRRVHDEGRATLDEMKSDSD